MHLFTTAGCGTDINCEDCKIRNYVVETCTCGKSFDGISTVPYIKKNNLLKPYNLQMAIERVGDLALIRIDKYEKFA